MNLKSAIHTACLLEVTARKPGNVHPLASFHDCDWQTFADSAEAIAPILADAHKMGVGAAILSAVRATQERVGRNTNLGMILLLAPLAAAAAFDGDLRRNVALVLDSLTLRDAELVYEAIRVAKPGGLGNASKADVAESPTIGLVEAMRLAADRDDVARQFVNGFDDVFRLSTAFDAQDLATLEAQIVRAHVARIATASDTLIARKCGPEIARQASERAKKALDGNPETLADFDAWLRADGNRRNPGTTADLIAAALFVALLKGQIPLLNPSVIFAFADRTRM
ncbi:MAG: triphosphoribosyl-dephospho-CoA synthase [Planctomycetota bacterium]|nr:triphosphoribosyl-dephospho-CoA synthase [Planctomycetota bacterium]